MQIIRLCAYIMLIFFGSAGASSEITKPPYEYEIIARCECPFCEKEMSVVPCTPCAQKLQAAGYAKFGAVVAIKDLAVEEDKNSTNSLTDLINTGVEKRVLNVRQVLSDEAVKKILAYEAIKNSTMISVLFVDRERLMNALQVHRKKSTSIHDTIEHAYIKSPQLVTIPIAKKETRSATISSATTPLIQNSVQDAQMHDASCCTCVIL